MIDHRELAAVAQRLTAAADRCEQLRTEQRSAAEGLCATSSGRTVSAAAAAGQRITEHGFDRLGGHLQVLASATSRFAAAAAAADAQHALIDASERRELMVAGLRDGGGAGAHTMIASALIAADRDAVDDDLVDAARMSGEDSAADHAAGHPPAIPLGALTAGALVGGTALTAGIGSAATDHGADADLLQQIRNRLVELAPYFPIHLPGWRAAVGLCRGDDDSARIVIATPEPAPYLRPGFTLRADETHVGAGIEPELAMLNYAQAQALSVTAIATTGAADDVLDVLTDHDVDVLDPLGFVDG